MGDYGSVFPVYDNFYQEQIIKPSLFATSKQIQTIKDKPDHNKGGGDYSAVAGFSGTGGQTPQTSETGASLIAQRSLAVCHTRSKGHTLQNLN